MNTSSQTDEIYLADMLAYARAAYSRVAGITYSEFASDENLEYAIRYFLMVVGEAASKVTAASRKRYPGIEWRRITGMRNQLVHSYTRISRDIVWDTAVEDLPPLIADLESQDELPLPPSDEIADRPITRELAIPIAHDQIAAFCRKWGIKRLSFFGSIVRDDFDPERSDVDVLVELRPDTKARGLAFFGAERELSEIFDGRKVEMMTGVRDSVWRYVEPDIVVEYAEEN